MAEKDTIFSGKIKQAGIFNFKEFYRFCYTWLVDEDYFVIEKVYSEKSNPDGKEIEIEWTALKKISDYFRLNLKINWRILGMTTVESQNENGNKIKLNKGNIEIKVSAILEKDYENRWESSAFL